MNRNIEIKLRLSKDEMQALMKCVKKTGMSREGYVRTLIRGYEPQAMPPIEYYDLLRELRAIESAMLRISDNAAALNVEHYEDYAVNAKRLTEICDSLTSAFLPRKRA